MFAYPYRNDEQDRLPASDDQLENSVIALIRHLRTVDKKIQDQLARLTALHHIDLMITTSDDLQATLNFLLEQLIRQLQVDGSEILLFVPQSKSLLPFVKVGGHVNESTLFLDYARQVAQGCCPIKVYDLYDPEGDCNNPAPEERYRAYVGLPLMTQGNLKGVLQLFHSTPLTPNPAWLNFLDTLAHQAVIAIDNTQLVKSLKERTEELEAQINERKRMERMLLASEKKHRTLFEDSKDVIFISSPAGQIIDINPAGLSLFGYTREEIRLTNAVHLYVNPDQRRRFREEIERNGSVKDFQLKARKKNGREVDALMTATLRLAEDGTILGYQGILRDITEHKRAEKLLAEYSRTLERQVSQRTAQLRARVQEVATLNRITQTVAAVSDLQTALEIVAQEITDLFKASTTGIALLNTARTEVTIVAQCSVKRNNSSSVGVVIPLTENSVARPVLQKGQSLVISKAEINSLPETVDPLISPRDTQCVMIVPLLAHGEVIGTIGITADNVDRGFQPSEVRLAETMAAQIAGAIENARLFAEEQRQRQIAESLRQVATIITSSLDRDTVLAKIMEQLGRVIEYGGAALLLLDDNQLAVSSGTNLPERYQACRLPLSSKEPIVQVFKSKAPLVIADVTRDPNWQICSPETDVRAWMGAPLLTDRQAIGVLTVNHFEVDAYDEADAQVLELFAHQAAIAITNSQLFELKQQANASLADTLQQLKASQDQLIVQEKMAWLGTLTSGIAHEIRNPLNFVNNFAGLSVDLAQELRDLIEPQKKHLDPQTHKEIGYLLNSLRSNASCIQEEGQRAERIVRSMLLHSRGSGGQPQKTDLNALLAEAVHLAYHSLRAKNMNFNIALEMDYDPTLSSVAVVPQDLSRVFLNLINNACYATDQKKRQLGASYSPILRVATKNLTQQVEIRIRDNGPGLSPEVRPQIFNPFFTTKPTGEGTGLGLSISYDIIVQGHQGTIEVETEQGHYTEFIINLPKP